MAPGAQPRSQTTAGAAAAPTPASLRFAHFDVRPSERRLLVDGEEATIGARAFDVLLALIERRDRMVPKSELLDVVWPDTIVEENNLQVHISALRKLVGPSTIATIPGRGYRFTLTPADEVPAAAANAPRPPPVATSGDAAPQVQSPAGTNLAASYESLIGRDDDVAAVSALVTSHRLVTIVGPGGIGKTRLALEVARGTRGTHPNGTWWVDLAAIAAPERVAAAIADAAGTQLHEGDPAAALAESLRQLDLILVLDNCEHLVGDVARIVDGIRARAPGVTILATSQVALKVSAEEVYRLGTLPTPAAGAALEIARRHGAVALLERREQAGDRRFALDSGNAAAAIAICQALEGVALAIEMAAARVPAMGLDAVRAHLHERFQMLSVANRLAPVRHRTLLATLDWSHALLTDDEKVVLRRVGTFSGSFGIDAAKALAHDATLDEWAVLDALAGLVDKSLVQVEHQDPPRYRLLETTRLYALDRLAEAHETPSWRARHASVLAAVAHSAIRDNVTLTDAQWHDFYASDQQDLEAAFAHAVEQRQPHVAAATGLALRLMDLRRGNLSGLRARMHACFALIPEASGRDAAQLWDGVIPADQIAIDAIPRLDAARQRLAAWRDLDDPERVYSALCGLADELARAADFAGAQRALDEAQSLQRPEWPVRMRMQLPTQRGAVAMYAKDAPAYREHRRELLRLAELAGATRTATSARLGLGDAALLAEDYAEAATLCRAVAQELQAPQRAFTRGIALENLAN
ncbi:MAG: winged helix-turn-helix domain-containing protein, partial [Casimicrobiaceae bacterium]